MKEKITLNNTIKLSVVLAILLITGSVFYYFVILPTYNKGFLDNCLEKAREKHSERWKEYCKIDNRQIGTDGSCLLSSERADRLIEIYKESKNECFKKYPTR